MPKTIELSDEEVQAMSDIVYYERKDHWSSVDDRDDPMTLSYVNMMTDILEKLIGTRNEDHLR
jgi:hypothetical protein